MKSRFNKVAVLTALVLTSPFIGFAGTQPKVWTLSKSEMKNHADATRAVQKGKGTGMTRQNGTVKSSPARTNWSDPAFRK
jgi:hypothetical protein